MDLSVVILNFNTRDLLRQCLASLKVALDEEMGAIFGGTTGQFGAERPILTSEVFVVDNASSDGSGDTVAREFPWVNLIRSPKNIGFASGNNLAVPQTRGRYVLFLNPDTIVPAGTLSEMVRFLDARPEAGGGTCYIELAKGGMDIDCHRGFPTPWAALCHFSNLERLFPRSRVFSKYFQGWKGLATTHEVDSGSGAFLMVRRDAAEAVRVPSCGQGWWDEDYFFYGEDLDFCYRLNEGGWRFFYHPEVKIVHYAGAASGMKKSSAQVSTATWETTVRVLRASTEAMKIFYRKHYVNRYPKPVTWSVFVSIGLLSQLRILSHRLKRGR